MRQVIGVLAACLLASSALPATPLTVDFAAGGYSMYGIGYNSGNPDFDQLLIAEEDGTIVLEPGTPQVVAINPYTFGVDVNSAYEEYVADMWITRTLTVGGVTQTLEQEFDLAISYNDTLGIYEGTPVVFDLGSRGRVTVTPLGVAHPPQPIGFSNGWLEAEFVYDAPEPGSLALFGLGLLGLGMVRRRAR